MAVSFTFANLGRCYWYAHETKKDRAKMLYKAAIASGRALPTVSDISPTSLDLTGADYQNSPAIISIEPHGKLYNHDIVVTAEEEELLGDRMMNENIEHIACLLKQALGRLRAVERRLEVEWQRQVAASNAQKMPAPTKEYLEELVVKAALDSDNMTLKEVDGQVVAIKEPSLPRGRPKKARHGKLDWGSQAPTRQPDEAPATP